MFSHKLCLCDPMDCSPTGPLFMGFPRQEYWNGWPFPSPGDLPDPGIELPHHRRILSPLSHYVHFLDIKAIAHCGANIILHALKNQNNVCDSFYCICAVFEVTSVVSDSVQPYRL